MAIRGLNFAKNSMLAPKPCPVLLVTTLINVFPVLESLFSLGAKHGQPLLSTVFQRSNKAFRLSIINKATNHIPDKPVFSIPLGIVINV